MGCDIHCFIEYVVKQRPLYQQDEQIAWWSFGGQIRPSRNYRMFGYLAGVRTDSITPEIPPRGIAKQLATEAGEALWYRISGDEQLDEKECRVEQAKSWCKSGSVLSSPQDGFIPGNSVSHPDAHTHSWLNAEEYERALNRYFADCGLEVPNATRPVLATIAALRLLEVNISGLAEYLTILAAMQTLDQMGRTSRLVFWFDN